VRFDLNELIEEKVEELRTLSPKSKIIFTPASLPLVEADRERIEQVLTNLIFNAIKYSPNGGDITVTAEKQDKTVKVSVTDQGIGIPANMLKNIFSRFYRIPDTSVQTYPGMGLGLYISAGIVALHGGTISVESKVNDGSTFYFILPVDAIKIISA
jgi:signal transduction histidine kinase